MYYLCASITACYMCMGGRDSIQHCAPVWEKNSNNALHGIGNTAHGWQTVAAFSQNPFSGYQLGRTHRSFIVT